MIRPGTTPRYGLVFVAPNGDDLQKVMDLMERRKVKAVIDRSFHLSEAVEAYRYLEEGHATGKVVIYHGDKKQTNESKDEEPQTEAAATEA